MFFPGFFKLLAFCFDVIHFSLVVFVLTAWLFPALRRAHIAILIIVGLSWLLFIQSHGAGFCILTDLHWKLLRLTGVTNLPATYVQYVFLRVAGISVPEELAHRGVGIVWITTLMLSLYLTFGKSGGVYKYCLSGNGRPSLLRSTRKTAR